MARLFHTAARIRRRHLGLRHLPPGLDMDPPSTSGRMLDPQRQLSPTEAGDPHDGWDPLGGSSPAVSVSPAVLVDHATLDRSRDRGHQAPRSRAGRAHQADLVLTVLSLRSRGRHRPVKAEAPTYTLPLVDTWYASSQRYTPPSTWQQLLRWWNHIHPAA
jgi:hypothetical protein